MPFKPFYGSCPLCPTGKTSLIVVRKGWCGFHNHQQKNKSKKPKVIKPKKFKPRKLKKLKGLRYGQCIKCPADKLGFLETKYLCRYHNKEKKNEARSKRIIKLVGRAEKKKSLSHLIKKLDEIFSLFIRLRDSKGDGFGHCVTCPAIGHYTRMHCGHYITRAVYSIRWHPWNCWIQCEDCNCFKGGEQEIFREAINKRWGSDTAENLETKRHSTKKLERLELESLIREYTQKVNKIMADKSFTI